MKASRFSDAQTAFILKQGSDGVPVQREILIMGLPGAGKTAPAAALAPLLNAVVFNADAVRANP
jgi:SpoVK/Ycf46/Vps4 family AAA+-type ATPase